MVWQVARDKLVGLGTCVGKLTHTGKFRLTIGALDLLSQYAKYKVCGCGDASMAHGYRHRACNGAMMHAWHASWLHAW